MMHKNVIVLELGILGRNNEIFSKESKIELPKSLPLTMNYDNSEFYGKCFNFQRLNNKIICDIELTDEAEKMLNIMNILSVAPSFLIEKRSNVLKIESGSMNGISIVPNHALQELEGNLKVKQ